MASLHDFEDKLEGHAVGMGHREHRDNFAAAGHILLQRFVGEHQVRPQGTEGYHHALRVAGRTRGIVDDRQLFAVGGRLVFDVLLAEILGIFLAEQGVESLACFRQFFAARHQHRVVQVADDTLQVRHLPGIERGPYLITDEEQAGVTVVDDVVDLLGGKFVEDGNDNGAVGQGG